MRSALDALYTLAALFGAFLVIVPATARAEMGPIEELQSELDMWVPWFGIHSGATGQQVEGDLQSCCERLWVVNGAAVNPPVVTGNPLRAPAKGNTLMISPFVGGNVGLETPGWTNLPGSPRLFARGDATWMFSLDKFVAREGAPDTLAPPGGASAIFPGFPGAGIVGQGSTTTVHVDDFSFSGGFGVTFSFEAFDRTLRLRPSFEYMREQTTVEGLVTDAETVDPGSRATPTLPSINSTFRFLQIKGEESKWFNGIGPGLELEMDAARAGSFMITLFAGAMAYHWLGDRTITVNQNRVQAAIVGPAAGTFNTSLYEDDETAQWRYKRNRWGYRGQIGIRFRWQPE